MENRMSRTIPVLALLVAAAALQAQQPNPYQGTSNPPPDSTIQTSTTPPPKPPAGQPLVASPPAPAPAPAASQAPQQAQPQPSSVDPSANFPVAGTDDGVIQNSSPASAAPAQPALTERAYASDPDGDIVHPTPLGPGQLGEGTLIRVKLLDRLSTVDSEKGEPFRSQVASDVFQGNNVVIPAGSEIDGRVVEVSTGHLGGHGSMRLRPEVVILPAGTRGALLGGPVGAVAGGAVGAGVVTTHLLVDHPQATLEPGSVIDFTLTDTLSLTPAVAPGN